MAADMEIQPEVINSRKARPRLGAAMRNMRLISLRPVNIMVSVQARPTWGLVSNRATWAANLPGIQMSSQSRNAI